MGEKLDEYFVQEKTSIDKLLDFLVFIAVFVVTIFLILDIIAASGKSSIDFEQLQAYYLWANFVIFVIFLADLIRLWAESHGAKDFFQHNWLDVIATIPFALMGAAVSSWTILNAFKWIKFAKLNSAMKLQRLSRVSKITKEFKAASHLKREGEEYKRKHRL